MAYATIQRTAELVAAPANQRYNFSTSTQDLLGNVDANLEFTPYKTGLVYCAAMGLHAPPDSAHSHPEKPERILRIYSQLRASGCLARMRRIVPRAASKSEIELFHESGMYDGLERTAEFSRQVLAVHSAQLESSSSLYLNEHTALCARLSCGSVIEMCDAVASRRIRNGFAVVRPPGHHAEASRAMGFCFYNNVVVATRFLQQKYSRGKDAVHRVLILDWDVHHGNGTQQAFFDTPDTLYMSLHRYEEGRFYPGGLGGAVDQVGLGAGRGTNVNIPWPCAGMGDGDYLYAFQRVIMPIAQEYNPDFVIISAGFDAADGDDIGGMHVSPRAYAHMTQMLSALANGRLVVVLEGGYNLDATAQSALAVTKVILGEAPEPYSANELLCGIIAQKTVQEVAKVQEKHWKSIAASELDPRANDDAPLSRVGIPEIIRHHRAQRLFKEHNMLQIPLITNLAPYFQHAVFASDNLIDAEERNVLLFVHDLADLRAEKPMLKVNPHKEYKAIVDVTDTVLRWAQDAKMSMFDINLFPKREVTLKEGMALHESEARIAAMEAGVFGSGSATGGAASGSSSANGPSSGGGGGGSSSGGGGGGGGGVTSGGGVNGVGPVTSAHAANTAMLASATEQAKAINELVLYVWDNFIELSHPKTKVVVLGYGIRAGHALMNLFVERETEVTRRVQACGMVIGGLGTSLGTTLPLSAWVGSGVEGAGYGVSGSVGSGGLGGDGGSGSLANGGSGGHGGAGSGVGGGGGGGIGSHANVGPIGGANAGPAPVPHMQARQPRGVGGTGGPVPGRGTATATLTELPLVPSTHPDLRKWYKKHSKIVTAHDHPYWVWDLKANVGRKAGDVERDDNLNTIEVMRSSWPRMKAFFAKRLDIRDPDEDNMMEVSA